MKHTLLEGFGLESWKFVEASTKKQALGAGQSCAKRGKRKAVAQQSNEKPGRTTSRSFSPLKQLRIEVVPTKSLANNPYMRSAHSNTREVESNICEKSEKIKSRADVCTSTSLSEPWKTIQNGGFKISQYATGQLDHIAGSRVKRSLERKWKHRISFPTRATAQLNSEFFAKKLNPNSQHGCKKNPTLNLEDHPGFKGLEKVLSRPYSGPACFPAPQTLAAL